MFKRSGFSLLEALIVVLLIATLALFGFPLTTHWYESQLAWIMQKDIEQAIEHGLQESLILGEPLQLVPLHNQDWSSGLALLRESELTRSQQAILSAWPWRHTGVHVTWHGFLSEKYLRFTPDLSQAALNGFFRIESVTAPPAKLTVNRLGIVRLNKT